MKKTLLLTLSVCLILFGTNTVNSISSDEVEIGVLCGIVTDSDGDFVEDALVTVSFHGTTLTTMSDINGYYEIVGVSLCRCLKQVTCSKLGYVKIKMLMHIGECTVQDFVLEPSL